MCILDIWHHWEPSVGRFWWYRLGGSHSWRCSHRNCRHKSCR